MQARTHLIFIPFLIEQAAITSPMQGDRSLIDRERLVGGGTVTYVCEVEGSPLPTVTWYHNGERDLPQGVVIINSSVLTIAEPQVNHTGFYQCYVESSMLFDDSRAWILEVRMPGQT